MRHSQRMLTLAFVRPGGGDPLFNRIVALKEGADRPAAPAKGGGKSA